VPEREPVVVLREAICYLAYIATERHYAAQPALWERGERGRKLTMEDYTHHFRNLAPLRPDIWTAHVRYCEDLFAKRGLPSVWLTDAWSVMGEVLSAELPAAVAEPATAILRREPTGG
jgi:hypothetical protein